jgi:hypothetical protein
MAKTETTVQAVWWRGYQAVVDRASTTAKNPPSARAEARSARGTARVPRVNSTDDVVPRSLTSVPRRRLEALAWRHASPDERDGVPTTAGTVNRRLRIRRGDQEPILLPVAQITDAELMMKIPTDVLARVACSPSVSGDDDGGEGSCG